MRALAIFWAVLLVALAGGAAALAYLGPGAAPVADAPKLPPMRAFARPAPADETHPRIALVVAGVGLNEADSLEAARALPPDVTLAVSPYAAHLATVVPAARAAGHEVLMSVPMEPAGYPLADPGDHALMAGATRAQNRERLDWALGRADGYVGATSVLGDMRGERFSAVADQMEPVAARLAALGLLYIDGRTGAPRLPNLPSRDTDLVIDSNSDPAAFDARLAALEARAQAQGSALGVVGAVRPAITARLASWARGLGARGFTLAPVSAVVDAPARQASGGPAPGKS